MKKISIVATCKKGASVAKFRITPPIDISVSKTFINIDQAADAPLVKQLFFLPFTKKVVLENSTLIVERFEILEWEEVINEVSDQIENYLNSDGIIFNVEPTESKTPISIYAESTPNPSVMKFVANKKLVENNIEYKNIDEFVSKAPKCAMGTTLWQDEENKRFLNMEETIRKTNFFSLFP